MFKSLLPKEHDFFNLFEEHAGRSFYAARLLRDALDSQEMPIDFSTRIKELEHEGDSITHNTLETLHKTFITPLDREEIHALISGLDDVLDNIDATAQRFALYKIVGIHREARQMAEIIVNATDHLVHAIHGLSNMKNSGDILKRCVTIKSLESEGDGILRQAMVRLFSEYSQDPIYVIKWKEIYEFLEECIDATEDVANILEGIVLEHA